MKQPSFSNSQGVLKKALSIFWIDKKAIIKLEDWEIIDWYFQIPKLLNNGMWYDGVSLHFSEGWTHIEIYATVENRMLYGYNPKMFIVESRTQPVTCKLMLVK